MTYETLMFAHLSTVLPAFVLGGSQFLLKKGTALHKGVGKLYMVLMLATAAITLLMPAEVGPRLLNHFGFLHLLSGLVLWTVPTAWFAIRRGNKRRHMWAMIQLYIGGILIAGGFTLIPGRYLHGVLFG
jgi:uncharacterized membrane protein